MLCGAPKFGLVTYKNDDARVGYELSFDLCDLKDLAREATSPLGFDNFYGVFAVTEKEIVTLILQNALTTQRANIEDYTEANSDPTLKSSGNATVANHLEKLGGRGVVIDVQPTITEHGMGFAYRIDPKLIDELSTDELIVRFVDSLFDGPPSETASTLASLCKYPAFRSTHE